MSRASTGGYAAGKAAVQADKYFAKHGKAARAAWIAWLILAAVSYMMKYRKYGIVELLDNKLAGVHVSAAPAE